MGVTFCVIVIPFILLSKRRRRLEAEYIKEVQRKEAEYIQRLSQSGIDEIDVMSGHEFEVYLKALFANKGYLVKATPGSGDFGADLIIEKEEKRIAIQAKRYSQPVGVKAVQEVIAVAAMNYYNCTDAWVVSNNTYTKSAVQMAIRTNVQLMNREDLINMILENKSKVSVTL
ncbi:hypothetical protein CHH49_09815 [Terribacillus saccharophilus]|nr:hypothetical protein CHH49_09815 [Terribacillus saccharophilus]